MKTTNIQPLSLNEKGQYQGGFQTSTASNDDFSNGFFADNGNCKGGGWFDDNVNCNNSCSGCNKIKSLNQNEVG